MYTFMDYIVNAFGTSTDWNRDNSYSSLTATSDALLSFENPSTLSLNVSSLSTPNFASSYTLSTIGQIDGSISYLYTTFPLDNISAQSPSIPLRYLSRGYRDIRLPRLSVKDAKTNWPIEPNGRKPTLLHATLALPPPSTLTALYARRINANTLLSMSLYSKSVNTPTASSSSPPASVLAHLQHDTGRYSVEGLASTDSALLGFRGLWNFGLSPPGKTRQPSLIPETPLEEVEGSPDLILPPSPPPVAVDEAARVTAYRNRLDSKPSLLSAGAEFYYSPFSHVIGMSTGLRFTTLAPHITPPSSAASVSSGKPLAGTSASLLTPSNIAHSSFPYTMTLTLTPLTGSIGSTYSVRPTANLSLSSRCDFNFYSWESRYVIGAEIWRPRPHPPRSLHPLTPPSPSIQSFQSFPSPPPTPPIPEAEDAQAWLHTKLSGWFSPEESYLKRTRREREEENVLKLRVDDTFHFKALWTGRVKSLIVSAGVSVKPVDRGTGLWSGGSGSGSGSGSGMGSGSGRTGSGSGIGFDGENIKRWTGSFGVSVAYST